MSDTAYALIEQALILVVARRVGSAFVRIGQPRVIGVIIGGVLIGTDHPRR